MVARREHVRHCDTGPDREAGLELLSSRVPGSLAKRRVACLVWAGVFALALTTEAQELSSSAIRVQVGRDDGAVEFLAVGWPGALSIRGRGPAPEGSVTLNGDVLRGSFTFELGALRTGIDLRDRHMRDQYLQTSRFPLAEFTLDRINLWPATAAESFTCTDVPFEGTLRLLGVERPLNGLAVVSRRGRQVSVTANLRLNMQDFGIETPSFAGVVVAREVRLTVRFSAQIE